MKSNSNTAASVGDFLNADDLSFSGTVTKIDNEKTKYFNFSAYPNPTNGLINFDYEVESGKTKIKFLDVLGKEVYVTEKRSVDIGFLSSGIYYVIVEQNDKIMRQRIVKH